MNASLNEKLQAVKWGEYRLGDLFEVKSSTMRFDANKVVVEKNGRYPYIVRTSENNGQKGFIDEDESYLNDGNTIAFGQDTATMFYQEKPYFTGDKIKILKPKNERFSKKNAQFILAAMRKPFSSFSWGASRFNVGVIENQIILLPTKDAKIDFDFMESFIAELSAYLTVSGYDNYELSAEELDALRKYRNGNISLKEFSFNHIFNNIQQGRRLKKDDQLPGIIPFVMSGVTNTGVIGYISNPIVMFPKNSITVDIFGNTFYRNYDFGAGDDTGVYWNDKVEYTQNTMLYFAAAIQKSVFGKFSYGKKLRSSQSYNFLMKLPCKNDKPDFDTMDVLISAIQKLVIRDVVLYSDQKIAATKAVVAHKSNE